jgi:hypothetical protein
VTVTIDWNLLVLLFSPAFVVMFARFFLMN